MILYNTIITFLFLSFLLYSVFLNMDLIKVRADRDEWKKNANESLEGWEQANYAMNLQAESLNKYKEENARYHQSIGATNGRVTEGSKSGE